MSAPLPGGTALKRELGPAEAEKLLRPDGVFRLAARADSVKRSLYGRRAHYIRNIHLNYSNVCDAGCTFCDYGAPQTGPGARRYSVGECLDYLRPWAECDEVHITGGLDDCCGLDYAVELVSSVKREFGFYIKAFSAAEIHYFARRSSLSCEEVLRVLKDAGLDALPGGGAETLSVRLHKKMYPKKAGPGRWLEIHEAAHISGIPSNATMLFGYGETRQEIVEHLEKVRALQERTGGFLAFIPLAFVQRGTVPPAWKILAVIALSRLYLDNFPHIKSYWPTMGRQLAGLALHAGADDLDGTIGRENVMQAAETEAVPAMSEEMMRQFLLDCDLEPVRRTGAYAVA